MERFLAFLLPHRDYRDQDGLYLRRHFLTPLWFPKLVFLHLIAREDKDRHPHSHPWGWWGRVLWGGYEEAVYDIVDSRPVLRGIMVRRPGPGACRGIDFVHRIVRHIKGRSWTLVVTDRSDYKKLDWYFWTEDGPVHERQYTSVHKDNR